MYVQLPLHVREHETHVQTLSRRVTFTHPGFVDESKWKQITKSYIGQNLAHSRRLDPHEIWRWQQD